MPRREICVSDTHLLRNEKVAQWGALLNRIELTPVRGRNRKRAKGPAMTPACAQIPASGVNRRIGVIRAINAP